MKFRVDEISSVLTEEIRQYRSQVDVAEVGRVLEVGDGIARIYGLSKAMAGELLEFENGARGQVFNLEESSVGVVILGDYLGIKEGDEVLWAGRWTARGSSRRRRGGRWNSKPRASPSASR
jgi:F-type H+-transporting ATPase subunit alpha